jgi:hypothetical protein
MGHYAVVAFVLIALFQTAAWSGEWTSDGAHVSIVRNVHSTPHGWDQTAENLTQSAAYRIAIAQTDASVAIDFPRGAGNILTIPPCVVGAEPQTIVTNRGSWWTKTVVSAQWIGPELEIVSVVSSGWWKDGTPDQARQKLGDFQKRVRLVPGKGVDDLSIHVSVADEKGELEYVQTFRRQP